MKRILIQIIIREHAHVFGYKLECLEPTPIVPCVKRDNVFRT